MRYTKPIATALAVTLGALTFTGNAEARDRWHRHHHHRGGGDAAAAGIFGFAAGALLGGALAGPRYYHEPRYYHRRYYDEPDVVYVEPRRVYVAPRAVRYSYEPWSPEWFAYCDSEYRSFDPHTGYFKGYDGHFHFCR